MRRLRRTRIVGSLLRFFEWRDWDIAFLSKREYEAIIKAVAIVEPEKPITDRRIEEMLSELLLEAVNEVEDEYLIDVTERLQLNTSDESEDKK